MCLLFWTTVVAYCTVPSKGPLETTGSADTSRQHTQYSYVPKLVVDKLFQKTIFSSSFLPLTPVGSTGKKDGGSCYQLECDTQAFIEQLNEEGLCAQPASWRLPTQKELQSLDHPTRFNPDAYTEFFPNVMSGQYWSASENQYSATLAWSVDFANGISYVSEKRLSRYLRAVSGPHKDWVKR